MDNKEYLASERAQSWREELRKSKSNKENESPNSVAHEVPMVSFGFFQARKQRRREDSLLPTSPIVLSSLVIHLSRSSAIVLQGAGGFEAYLLPLP